MNTNKRILKSTIDDWTNGNIIPPLRVFDSMACGRIHYKKLRAMHFDFKKATWTTFQRYRDIERQKYRETERRENGRTYNINQNSLGSSGSQCGDKHQDYMINVSHSTLLIGHYGTLLALILWHIFPIPATVFQLSIFDGFFNFKFLISLISMKILMELLQTNNFNVMCNVLPLPILIQTTVMGTREAVFCLEKLWSCAFLKQCNFMD